MTSYSYRYHCTACGNGGMGLCSTQPPATLPCSKCGVALDVEVETSNDKEDGLQPFTMPIG